MLGVREKKSGSGKKNKNNKKKTQSQYQSGRWKHEYIVSNRYPPEIMGEVRKKRKKDTEVGRKDSKKKRGANIKPVRVVWERNENRGRNRKVENFKGQRQRDKDS